MRILERNYGIDGGVAKLLVVAIVEITTFTDPACPFAYDAEPIRWRLQWLFGDQIEWQLRLVGLSKDGSSYEKKGFTPERAGRNLRQFDAGGQPLSLEPTRPVGATWPACQAVVAVRENLGTRAATRLARFLQRSHLAQAKPLRSEEVIAEAINAAELVLEQVNAWRASPATIAAFEADLSAARRPSAAALAMDKKLAPTGEDWEHDADGPLATRRYTCPSYVLRRPDTGQTLEAPGFHTLLTIETLLANLAPELQPRASTKDPIAILRWAGEPLTTQEVAAVMNRADARESARKSLAACGAFEEKLGSDAIWSIH